MLKRILQIIAGVVFFASLLINIILGYTVYQQKKANLVKVIGVIDGDTVVLENKTRLRLRQMDAPEPKYCGGKQATELLSSLVLNKMVKIDEQIPDQMGRAMAFLIVEDVQVNEQMLASGWARYHSDATSQTAKLKEVSRQAKDGKKGIYSELCLQTKNADNPKCIIKGNLENKRTSGRKLYYLSNCAQYQFVQIEKDLGEQWFCTEKEASAAGYIKAETCPKVGEEIIISFYRQ